MRPPPSTTAAIGTGNLVRRMAVVAASITVDHVATEVVKGNVARYPGSSASGRTVKVWSPGLFQRPTTYEPSEQDG